MRFLLLFLLLIPSPSLAANLFALRTMSVETYKLADYRDANYPIESEAWIGGVAVNFDLDLMKEGDWGLVWDNTVRGNGTAAQMREVGWLYEVGFDMGPKVRLLWQHESRHLLDARSTHPFPLTNMYGVRINFYERGK